MDTGCECDLTAGCIGQLVKIVKKPPPACTEESFINMIDNVEWTGCTGGLIPIEDEPVTTTTTTTPTTTTPKQPSKE